MDDVIYMHKLEEDGPPNTPIPQSRQQRILPAPISTCFRSGFTLIELLVVIAIAGILAALLLGAFAEAKQQGISTYCKNNLHQIGLATELYVEDSGYYPYYQSSTGLWERALKFYYPPTLAQAYQPFDCPAYRGILPLWNGAGASPPGVGSYAYNADGSGAPFVNDREVDYYLGLGLDVLNCLDDGVSAGVLTSASVGVLQPRKASQVVAPSEMFAFMDVVGVAVDYGQNINAGWLGFDHAGAAIQAPPDGFQTLPQHGKYFNVVSPDGHVEALKTNNLFYVAETPNYQFTTGMRWNIDHKAHPEFMATRNP
jgi:prepilin-type N-terminal cleavage/methylation domain-containing protein